MRRRSAADNKTSHMFFGGAGKEANLKQSGGCSKRSDCFKNFFDEIEFGPRMTPTHTNETLASKKGATELAPSEARRDGLGVKRRAMTVGGRREIREKQTRLSGCFPDCVVSWNGVSTPYGK